VPLQPFVAARRKAAAEMLPAVRDLHLLKRITNPLLPFCRRQAKIDQWQLYIFKDV